MKRFYGDGMSTDKTIDMKRFVRSSNNIYILPLHKLLSLVKAEKSLKFYPRKFRI